METTEQNTKQFMEENDVLKQFMELLNQQDMGEQSQDFMELFKYAAGMQLQLAVMVDELQGVRQQQRKQYPAHSDAASGCDIRCRVQGMAEEF